MDISNPENQGVLAYVLRCQRAAPAFALPDSVQNPYYGCGCHPDIVERLWDQIGPRLPADCRCLIHGIPALAHSPSGVILGIGIGTQYGLRLPGALGLEATRAGAKLTTRWSTGGEMDIRRDLGDDWVFGAWLPAELVWCKAVYDSFELLG